jgi:hypothetical protein
MSNPVDDCGPWRVPVHRSRGTGATDQPPGDADTKNRPVLIPPSLGGLVRGSHDAPGEVNVAEATVPGEPPRR